MAKSELEINLRQKDEDLRCPCGSKTFPIAKLLGDSVIEVSIYCQRCGALIKRYNRMIQQRRAHD